MKAIISSTGNPKYFFFIPLVVWCWNRLGINVDCFMPTNQAETGGRELQLLDEWIDKLNLKINIQFFNCPEHKEATFAQCARLYNGLLDENVDKTHVISDIDMLVFKVPPHDPDCFTIFGYDLVPKEQYPMCYISAPRSLWNKFFNKEKSYQECLDELLGHIECESFAGNYWGKDQETAFKSISDYAPIRMLRRARPGTQFAENRLDRDDSFLLDRLSPDIFDYHMPRPGYEDKAFEQILTVLHYFYPTDSFDWLISYREAYLKLL